MKPKATRAWNDFQSSMDQLELTTGHQFATQAREKIKLLAARSTRYSARDLAAALAEYMRWNDHTLDVAIENLGKDLGIY